MPTTYLLRFITKCRLMRCYAAADAGDDKCYETFNTAGRFNGHCGLNGTSGGYLQCAAEYVVYVRCVVFLFQKQQVCCHYCHKLCFYKLCNL